MFNFGTGHPVSVQDIVARITKFTDNRETTPTILNEAQFEIHNQYLSSDRAREVLGWSPNFDLDEGLRLTIDWYKRYFESGPSPSFPPVGNE